jgi:hypothetical protein
MVFDVILLLMRILFLETKLVLFFSLAQYYNLIQETNVYLHLDYLYIMFLLSSSDNKYFYPTGMFSFRCRRFNYKNTKTDHFYMNMSK